MYTEKEKDHYCGMDQKKLLKLNDKELVTAVHIRKEEKAVKQLKANIRYDDIRNQRSEPEKTADTIYYFYSSVIEHPKLELDELGMYYFLAGYTREYYVPYLSESLRKIKANEYKLVFDEFIIENNIDVNDLSEFPKETDSAYYKQAEMYDFSATDEKLRGMTGLIECLARYIRENISCFAEDKAPPKPSIFTVHRRKSLAKSMLKKILVALHEKRFEDVVALVTESTLNAEDIEECIQGTVEDNGFSRMDKYIAKNVCGFYVEEDYVSIEYYLTADGNQELPLCLILDISEDEDGTVKSVLNIDAC